jgi:hypothetical protein
MNIGVVIPHLGQSQIGFSAIKAINKIALDGYQHDLVLFFEQFTMPVIQPQCAAMCINELVSFKGTFITSTLNNTSMVLARNSRKKNKVVFYVWDIEWMRPGMNNYLYNYGVFNGVTKIIARSPEHARAIENYCNRKVDLVLTEFNVNEMIK